MKGIIKVVAVFMLLISFSLGIVACADPSQDNFYSLKDAYEIGLLTREDLVEISTNYQASSPDREDKLINDVGQEEYQKIKNAALNIIEKKEELTVSDITLLSYYGKFGDLIVLRIAEKDIVYPDVVTTIKIDGVEIFYTGAEILVWKITKN